jgi:NTE family protein
VRAPEAARGFYTDGATRLNSPIKPAVELGADRVIVIGFEPLRRPDEVAPEHVPPHLVDVLANMLDGLLVDQVADDVHRLVFDPAYVEALIEAGRHDARRWLARHPGFWCSDGAHDFDIAAAPDVSAQEAASLDEWRSLRRG